MEKKILFKTKQQNVEIISDKKESKDSDNNFNISISSKNQNNYMCQNAGNLFEDNILLGNKRKEGKELSDLIKKDAENPLDLLNNINPKSNLECNIIYFLIYLFNIIYSLYAI